jgi:hypothetical protein
VVVGYDLKEFLFSILVGRYAFFAVKYRTIVAVVVGVRIEVLIVAKVTYRIIRDVIDQISYLLLPKYITSHYFNHDMTLGTFLNEQINTRYDFVIFFYTSYPN